MTKPPVLKGTELVSLIQAQGFILVRQKGSHVRLKHPDGRAVTVPVHSGRDISIGLLTKIVSESAIEL